MFQSDAIISPERIFLQTQNVAVSILKCNRKRNWIAEAAQNIFKVK